jgi:hypothetical protein
MKKIKLLGIGNTNERHYFIFEKTLEFFPAFLKFFEQTKVSKTGSFYDYDENNTDLESHTDIIENTHNEEYDIDIFFGKDKIIVVIRTEIEKKQLMKYINEFSEIKN